MIYPILQVENLSSQKIEVKSLQFSGICLDTLKNVFKQYNIPQGDDFTVKAQLINLKENESKEKYFITIAENNALIKASNKRGFFRGMHTLLKLIEKNELFTGEIEDYPLFETRGYIEGFYGNTWEPEKRLSVMRLMAKYGMNTFYYAPKDDVYHREKWREMYPDKDYDNLKQLFSYASEHEFDFYWCIGPGLTYHYSDKNDFFTLINKIKSVYNMSIKNFGLLLDDIPWDFQYPDDKSNFTNIADAHIKLINDLYYELKQFDNSINLTVCPTEYFGNENGDYISKLGKSIPADVKLFWTGQEICSRVLTCRECNDFINSTSHKPLFWDNYPVNDCEMFNEMHLGAVKGRDAQLYKTCDGLISNVMEYAECSKIPLVTIADYLWNPIAYNPEKSLNNAHEEILGEKAELFKYFADHLCVSCLSRYGGSQIMSDTLTHISFLISTGKKEEAFCEFESYINKMHACLNMIKDTSVELFKELSKWVEKFEMCCELLTKIKETQLSPTEENKTELQKMLNIYNRDAIALTGFCLREAAEKTLMVI